MKVRVLKCAATTLVGLISLACAHAQAAVADVSRICVPNKSEASVAEFGARGDALSDNLQAFKEALSYVARCSVPTLRIPAGRYKFILSGPVNGLNLGSNLALVGEGVGRTSLEIDANQPGANFASLFWMRNQDNVSIQGISFVGNNIRVQGPSGTPLVTYGSAVTIALDAKGSLPEFGEPHNLKHFLIQDNSFENFNGGAWISVINYSPRFSIDDVKIVGNSFASREGNAINGALMTYPAAAISIMGSLTSVGGVVTHTLIARNTIQARHIKSGINIWSGVSGAIIEDNRILEAGADDSIANDAGAYAINIYNNAYYHDVRHASGELMGGIRPDQIRIERNIITDPRSCGVYAAAANHLWVVGNTISGQTDPLNATLPKGAIALNQPLQAVVADNHLSGNHIGMDLYEGISGHISESGNRIEAVPRSGFGIFSRRSSR